MKEKNKLQSIEGLTINKSEYDLENGEKGILAVFLYSGDDEPRTVLDFAVKQYVGDEDYHELVSAKFDNPWMRVILSNINDMKQHLFDPNKDCLTRKQKVNRVI